MRPRAGGKQRHAAAKSRHGKHAEAKRKSKKQDDEPRTKPAAPPLTGDLAALKDAIDLARKGKTDDASAAATALPIPPDKSSPTGSCCAIPRAPRTSSATPPSSPPIRIGRAPRCCAAAPRRGCGRRRATRRPCTPSRWTGRPAPRVTSRSPACCSPKATATGRRVWCARPGARRNCPSAARKDAYAAFRDLLTAEDHRARMDKRLGAKDYAGARRAAKRLGDDALAIVKACAAVNGKANKAKDYLDDVSRRCAPRPRLCPVPRRNGILQKDRIDDAADVILAPRPTPWRRRTPMPGGASAACWRETARPGQVQDRLRRGARGRGAGR